MNIADSDRGTLGLLNCMTIGDICSKDGLVPVDKGKDTRDETQKQDCRQEVGSSGGSSHDAASRLVLARKTIAVNGQIEENVSGAAFKN